MNYAVNEIRQSLLSLQDLKYRDFHGALMPTVDRSTVIGVRMPALRALVKEISCQPELVREFMDSLPHQYYEENNVHGCLIAGCRDFETCIKQLTDFLPYMDNWSTCDMLVPKIFAKHRSQLLPYIETWLASDHPYTVRFGMKMLMDFYLDDDFEAKYPAMVASVKSEEYYVNMMIAWYFATALAKRWDSVIGYFAEPGGNGRPALDKWTHNKAIQKAIESYRITEEQKAYLRTLKIK